MSRIRTTSQTWKSIVSSGNFTLETKAVIGAKEYTAISAPVIDQTLMSSPLSVGNVNSATLEVSILTEDTIPAGAEVEIQGRVKEGDQTSEWLPFGTFFINQRDTSYDGLVTISCYDALLKASRGYITTVGDSDPDSWPRLMADVVNAIAQQIGVEVDERTVIETGEDYKVAHPGTLTMTEILGYIGACHGGNWIITPENKLRLVPLAGYSENSTVIAQAVLGQLSTGPALTVSAVQAEDGDRSSFTAGNASGATIDLGQNPYVTQQICEDLLQKYNGLVYAPFDATKVIYDPAAELGDPIKIGSAASGVILKSRMTLDLMCSSNISAPNSEELTAEYPYLSQSKKLQEIAAQLDQAVQDAADMAAEAAESLLADYVKTDYLEANYVKVGTLEAEIGHFEDLLAEYASIDYLEAHYAKIDDLEVVTGNFENLLADYAKIDYLEANYISAGNISSTNIDTGTLTTTIANIASLLAGNAGIGDLQAINLSSANVNIADATITDAMIASLTASKLTAGTIYTNRVTIQSGEGDDSLWISGSVIQMSDQNRVRVQIGKDAGGTYNFYIWDANGNLMWNALGVTGSGLNDGIIVDKNVADNAAINGSKLDIQSVAEHLMDDGTLVLDSSRVKINDQTLSAVYTTITQSVTALQNNVSTLQTSLNVVQGQISSKVWVSDIETATDELGNEITTLTDQYSALVQTQSSLSAKVSSLETTSTSHTSQIAGLQVTVDGFSSKVSSAINEALEGYATQAYVASQISQTTDSITTTVESTLKNYATNSSVSEKIEEEIGNIQIGGRNLFKNSEFSDGTSSWNGSNSSKVSVETLDEKTVLKVDTGTAVTSSAYGVQSIRDDVELSSEYIASAFVYVENAINVAIVIWYDSGGWKEIGRRNFSCQAGWNRIYTPFKSSSTVANLVVGFGADKPNVLYIYHPKLEKGNVATDWTPAPEDYATATSVASQIAQSYESINLTLQQDYATKASLALQLNTDTGVATLAAAADRIELTSGQLVIKSGGLTLDANGNAVFKGQITSSAGSIGGWTINDSSISKSVVVDGETFTTTLYGAGQDKAIVVGQSGSEAQFTLYANGRAESMTQIVSKELICSPLQDDWENSSPDAPFFVRCQYQGSYNFYSMSLRFFSLDYSTYKAFATFSPGTDSGFNINLGRSTLPFNNAYMCNLTLYEKYDIFSGIDKYSFSDEGFRMYFSDVQVDSSYNYVVKNNPLLVSLWRNQSGYHPGTLSIYNVSDRANPFISFRIDPQDNELSLYNYVQKSRYIILNGTQGSGTFHGMVTCSYCSQTSDERLKKNIETLDGDKSKAFILGLRPVKFEFTAEDDDDIHSGFVAQEVDALQGDLGVKIAEELTLPAPDPDEQAAVATMSVEDERLDTEWTLNYSAIIAPLVAVVQSQQEEINDLKQKVSALSA